MSRKSLAGLATALLVLVSVLAASAAPAHADGTDPGSAAAQPSTLPADIPPAPADVGLAAPPAGMRAIPAGVPIPPGASPFVPAACGYYGYVVLMIYTSWTTSLPAGTCYTIYKPATDGTDYTNCDISGGSPNKSGSGSEWVYDDTNEGGHPGGTDGYLNNLKCGNHQAYWGEYEGGRSGGYHWDWSPTLLFEEDYNSSHEDFPYSGTTAAGSWAGTASSYTPVPTLDAGETSDSGSLSFATRIGDDCHTAGVYVGVYYISFYNNTDPGTKESTIASALNGCYY